MPVPASVAALSSVPPIALILEILRDRFPELSVVAELPDLDRERPPFMVHVQMVQAVRSDDSNPLFLQDVGFAVDCYASDEPGSMYAALQMSHACKRALLDAFTLNRSYGRLGQLTRIRPLEVDVSLPQPAPSVHVVRANYVGTVCPPRN